MTQNELLFASDETIRENFLNSQNKELKYSYIRMSFNTLVRKNGEKIPVKNSIRTILLEGELYIFAIIFNLSEGVKVSNELKQARIRADKLNKLKGFSLANMSNEFRTPLIGIMGYSQILQ